MILPEWALVTGSGGKESAKDREKRKTAGSCPWCSGSVYFDYRGKLRKHPSACFKGENVSVDITRKVTEAFTRQTEKIQETKGIFTSLNQEIEQAGEVIGGIASEVTGLKNSKDTIEDGVSDLTRSAESNTKSAQDTLESMEEFKEIVEKCKSSTEQIQAVSKELIEDIHKFDIRKLKEEVREIL